MLTVRCIRAVHGSLQEKPEGCLQVDCDRCLGDEPGRSRGCLEQAAGQSCLNTGISRLDSIITNVLCTMRETLIART